MKVLILGAGGFIGPHLEAALRRQGAEVAAASRSGGGPSGVALDRRDVAAVQALVRTAEIDAVVDLLAFTEADTLPLYDALEGAVGRWVMASSCDVYRNYAGLQRRTEAPPIMEPMAEAAPLREQLFPYRGPTPRPCDAPDAWMDRYDKIPLEKALLAKTDLSGVVARLPMIYGPGDRQRRFSWIIQPMLAKKAELVVDPRWRAWRTTYGYVADVADALATVALHPAAGGHVFNVGEAAPPTHDGWVRRFADLLEWHGSVVDSPAEADSPLATLDLSYPLNINSTAIRTWCGWSEPTPPEEAWRRTLADEKGRH